jgi:hypothetical protein
MNCKETDCCNADYIELYQQRLKLRTYMIYQVQILMQIRNN